MKWLRRGAIAIAVFVAAIVIYNGVAYLLAMNSNPPDTAALESKWLGPEDSDKAILLVHGFVGSHRDFGALPEALAEAGWRVRLMRLPGHCTKPRDLIGIDADEIVTAVRDEAKRVQEDYDFFAIGGFSMGGALSTITAADVKPDALVLAAPYFGVTHKWFYGLRPETWAKIAAPVIRWTYKGKIFIQVNRREARKDIFIYEWMPASATKFLMDLGERANDSGTLSEVQCPVLWLHGPGDNAADYYAAKRAFGAIASEDKTHVPFEESNHHVFWDYEREQVVEEIVTFLNQRAGANESRGESNESEVDTP